jgi:hypothetical protein
MACLAWHCALIPPMQHRSRIVNGLRRMRRAEIELNEVQGEFQPCETNADMKNPGNV